MEFATRYNEGIEGWVSNGTGLWQVSISTQTAFFRPASRVLRHEAHQIPCHAKPPDIALSRYDITDTIPGSSMVGWEVGNKSKTTPSVRIGYLGFINILHSVPIPPCRRDGRVLYRLCFLHFASCRVCLRHSNDPVQTVQIAIWEEIKIRHFI